MLFVSSSIEIKKKIYIYIYIYIKKNLDSYSAPFFPPTLLYNQQT